MTQKSELPPIARRRVGGQLRLWRERAGFKPGDGARHVDWPQPKLSRVERGVYRITAEEIDHLYGKYGVDDEAALAEVKRVADEPKNVGWWKPFEGRVSQAYIDFIALEAEATTIRVQNPVVVPGPAQSPGYVREIITRSPQELTDQRAEMLISIRMARQGVLSRTGEPVKLHILVPESSLHARFESGPSTMRDQIRKLIDTADMPNVTLQVVPLTAHPTYGSSGAMSILTFRHPWAPVASIDNPMGGTQTEDPEQVRYLEIEFDHIASAALPVDKSRDLLNEHLEGLHK
ncbi:helix-turn-helix transcriptional regulator [Streptomyces sp. NPDC047718]|uniref:helix-turn-helix domain-containing protein n=1 Tax=Streptomyces sp. NPDC047718 TaxID=3155479 RepID=UPI0033C5A82B